MTHRIRRINVKKVIVEFIDVEGNGIQTKSEKECIELVHKILLGAEPYPFMDPCRPYVGTMVNIKCGDTTEICSVWNQKNVRRKH